MKKTLFKFGAIYFIISIFAINAQVLTIMSAEAATADYPKVQCINLTEDLIYGSKDQDTRNQVTLLQVFLTQKGYEIGSDTFGTFGYGTKDAVAYLQKNSGMTATGFVGSNTRSLIQKMSCTTDYSGLSDTMKVSVMPVNVCGTNNGKIWNGTSCVNLCDQYHPWNPNTEKCSTAQDMYYGNNGGYSSQSVQISSSCNSGYYWTGTSCSQNSYNTSYSSNYTASTINVCGVYGREYVWTGSVCMKTTNTNSYSYPSTNYNYTNNASVNMSNDCVNLNVNNCNYQNQVNGNNGQVVIYQNSNYAGSCQAAYGQSYFWNGKYCVQQNTANNCGSDDNLYWTGSVCAPKYITKYLCKTNGQYYEDKSRCPTGNNNDGNGYVNIYDSYYINNNYNDQNGFVSYQNDYNSNYSNQVSQNNNVICEGYYDIYGNYHKL